MTYQADFSNEYLDEDGTIKKSEFIRLIQQSLAQLGYDSLANKLAESSGHECEAPSVSRLRHFINEGAWLSAVDAAEDCSELTQDQLRKVKYLLMQEHVLESIISKKHMDALECIRTRMQPLGVCQQELHDLTGCLVCESAEEIMETLKWAGPTEVGRQNALKAVQSIVPAHVMIPPDRLTQLLRQAFETQRASVFHFDNCSGEDISLFADFRATIDCLPISCTQVLSDHKDEVQDVEFSPNGKWLATCSKDGAVLIWNVNLNRRELELHQTIMDGSHGAVSTLAWSADSTRLVAVCDALSVSGRRASETEVLLLDPQDPSSSTILSSGSVKSVCWCRDGRHIITVDSSQELCILAADQSSPALKFKPGKMHDIAASPDGQWFAISFGHNVKLFSAKALLECTPSQIKNAEVASFLPKDDAHNVAFSQDSRLLLMDIKDRSVVVCEITRSTVENGSSSTSNGTSGSVHLMYKHRLQPPKVSSERECMIIKPTFGGKKNCFVAMGSEQGEVRLWHWPTKKFLKALQGHTKPVNGVAWHPRDQHILVSVSDDSTVRVWTSPVVG